ncbi:MAG: lamin tail domain-containing protein [Bacteroidales bacterium]|jgi:hypothetical protein|nr:lamin tail domain-containing protein [Bacteroidales bacterium]
MKKIMMLPLLPLYLSVTAQTGADSVVIPSIGDLVITEIMADPTPSRGLPEREYLEITNRSQDILGIAGILLIAGSDTAFLGDGMLAPGERMILCSTGSRSDLLQYGMVMAVKSFPSLNDAGEQIALRNPDGSLVHAVCYGPEFLGDGPRSGGGWSAELADLSNPFNEPYAWSPSEDPSGGTPGRVNSREENIPDTRPPKVIAVWPASSDTVAVLFDETVICAGAGPWEAGNRQTLPAVSGDHTDRTALVPLAGVMDPGAIITLVIPARITDFAGNAPSDNQLRTGLSAEPMPGDILFNELMPDPPGGVSEYLELYNNSDAVFDLSCLYLSGGSNSQATSFTGIHRQLLPADYVALTTGSEEIREHFPCSDEASVFRADRLPSMPDDGGSLILYDRNLNVIDRVDYNSGMHMIFLSGTDGVALEKVSPVSASDVASNWHSAVAACNWGTPGAPNSIMIEDTGENEGLSLSSGRISPDGDGFEDIISVGVFPGGEDNIITLTIFNDRGYPVRRLAERISAGPSTHFAWDGLSDSGARLPSGLYLILAESYNPSGSSGRWKKVCALLYR